MNQLEKDIIESKPQLAPHEYARAPVTALAIDYRDGEHVPRHRHRRAQLLYAIAGVMTVQAEGGIWVAPPTRGIWLPAGMAHSIRMHGQPRVRTVFVAPRAASHLPDRCSVLAVGPLLRELIVAATRVPPDWRPGGRDARLMALLLDEIRLEPALPLHLPQPDEPRVARVCRGIQRDPGAARGLGEWAAELGVTAKTVQRLFVRHTGMTFGRWRQQACLLRAMQRLAEGQRVVDVALESGYDSPSAFAAMFRRAVGEPPSAFAARREPPA